MASASPESSALPALIVPFGAGVTSTVGFLTAPLSFDFVRSYFARLDQIDWQHLRELFGEMERQGRDLLAASGVPDAEMRLRALRPTSAMPARGTRSASPVPGGTLDADSLPATGGDVSTPCTGRSSAAPDPRSALEAVSWRLVVSGPAAGAQAPRSRDRADRWSDHQG